MICNNEDWDCSNEPGHLQARLNGKGSKVLLYRVKLSEDISLFSDNAKVVAPEADPVFVFAVLKQLFVVILNLSNNALINVDIDLGCKEELEMVGKPEKLATIDSITAKDIASQPPKSSLYSEMITSSFFELVTVSDNKFKLPYDPELTVKDIKLLTICFDLHRRRQFNEAIHLFFLANELINDFQKLSEIPRFCPNSVIHIAHSGGRAPGIQFDSPYLTNFHNIEILLRNANECNRFAKKNANARERQRFSEPALDVEINDSFQAFGDLTERIGQLMVSYSTQLNRLSDVLDKDERMNPNSRKYDEAKQIIQNNLDTARYAGPMMKNFSSVRVDITNNRLSSN